MVRISLVLVILLYLGAAPAAAGQVIAGGAQGGATPVAGGQTGAGRGGGRGGIGMTAPPAIAPLPEGTGAISGVVVDADTGQPLEGAVVTISVPTRAPIGRASSELTDARGRFVFTRLPARADFQVAAAKPGYFDSSFGRDSLRSPAGPRIQLADGQWFDQARVTLWKAGAVSGLVLDELGEPVVGVYVRAFAQVPIAGTRQLAAGPIAITDDRGLYRIPGLGPGEYLVAVPSVSAAVPASSDAIFLGASAPRAVSGPQDASRLALTDYPIPPPPAHGQTFSYPIRFSPSAASVAGAIPIALRAGEERRDVNVRLEPVPAVRVSGRVDGPPEATAGLTLRLLASGLEDLGGGSETATSRVAADGTFTFLNVPAGTYTLDAARSLTELAYMQSGAAPRMPLPPGTDGFGMSSGSIASAPPGIGYSTLTSGGASDAFWARMTVTVTAGDVSGLVLTMHPTVSISGVVTYENPATAGPIVIATAEPANGSTSLGRPRQVRSSDLSKDEFRVEGLLSGSYFLRVLGNSQVVKSITWNGRDYTNRPFDASEGRDFGSVQVTLTDRAPTLGGTVRGRDRAPAADAAVIVFPVEPEQWTNYGWTPARLKSARASTAGVFSITGLPAGEYFVVAVPSSDVNVWQTSEFLKQAARSATRVSLSWGQTSNLDLTVVR